MYRYITNCVGWSEGDDIIEMTNIASDIDAETLLELSEELGFKDDILENLGYKSWSSDLQNSEDPKSPEELLSDDWSVSYGVSRFNGVPCVYVQHSHIEYIWCSDNLYSSVSDIDIQTRRRRLDILSEDFLEFCDNNEPTESELIAFFSENLQEFIKYSIPMESVLAENGVYRGAIFDQAKHLTIKSLPTDEKLLPFYCELVEGGDKKNTSRPKP